MGRSIEPCGTSDRISCHVLSSCPTLILRFLTIYYQTHKLEAWLKINHVGDSHVSLKGRLVMYQIPFLDLHYFP